MEPVWTGPGGLGVLNWDVKEGYSVMFLVRNLGNKMREGEGESEEKREWEGAPHNGSRHTLL